MYIDNDMHFTKEDMKPSLWVIPARTCERVTFPSTVCPGTVTVGPGARYSRRPRTAENADAGCSPKWQTGASLFIREDSGGWEGLSPCRSHLPWLCGRSPDHHLGPVFHPQPAATWQPGLRLLFAQWMNQVGRAHVLSAGFPAHSLRSWRRFQLSAASLGRRPTRGRWLAETRMEALHHFVC